MSMFQAHYLYHWVPDALAGHILYPLNQLKSINPSLYITKAAKYKQREALMQARLPILNCLWNDVLHFSPVHPDKIHQAMADAGFARKQWRYYEIDPYKKGVNATNAIIFLNQRNVSENFQFDEADFRVFDLAALSSLGGIPAATQAYYKEAFAQHKRPFVYSHVPHILYQGSLNIRDVKVIEIM